MDHILLLAAITFAILILRVLWKWLRKLQRRSGRKRGNNYLYQEYDYNYDIDYHAIDSAWDVQLGKIPRYEIEENDSDFDLELDLDLDLIIPDSHNDTQSRASEDPRSTEENFIREEDITFDSERSKTNRE